ncbi:PAC2 family protein [Chloroflexota bacterium]
MKVGAFELDRPPPELKEPHAFAMLRPWVDVGSVGTLILSWLETQFDARELCRLSRPGDFFDFTRYRPNIYYRAGLQQVAVPNAYVTYSRQRTGNDFLFFHLLEPHSHGEAYCDSILELLTKLGVKRYCLLGSMYDYVPHTRPLVVTGRGIGEGVAQELIRRGIQSSDYQGPTTITALLSWRAANVGIETMSLIVHLPQYTQMEEDYIGTVALMRVLTSLYDVTMDEAYVTKAEQQLEQINMALEKNPELKSIIQQLETHYEERAAREKGEGIPPLSPEIERFLSEMERRFKEE